jgi:hypothetical protein
MLNYGKVRHGHWNEKGNFVNLCLWILKFLAIYFGELQKIPVQQDNMPHQFCSYCVPLPRECVIFQISLIVKRTHDINLHQNANEMTRSKVQFFNTK